MQHSSEEFKTNSEPHLTASPQSSKFSTPLQHCSSFGPSSSTEGRDSLLGLKITERKRYTAEQEIVPIKKRAKSANLPKSETFWRRPIFQNAEKLKRGGFVLGFSFFLSGHGKQRKREHQQQRRGEDRWRLFHYEAESNRKVMLPPQIKTTLFLINLSLSLFLLFPFPFFVIYALSFVF
ncbi:hypothetical protein V8G54_019559 [Vigna mungo]|uniref:Uncharacterized protein n=1 Tax=Vigna mungo TaxID=3915 RepID=A0AAQ3RV23_VIGMU